MRCWEANYGREGRVATNDSGSKPGQGRGFLLKGRTRGARRGGVLSSSHLPMKLVQRWSLEQNGGSRGEPEAAAGGQRSYIPSIFMYGANHELAQAR